MRKQKPIDAVDEASIKYLDRSIMKTFVDMVHPRRRFIDNIYNQMRDNLERSSKPLFIRFDRGQKLEKLDPHQTDTIEFKSRVHGDFNAK